MKQVIQSLSVPDINHYDPMKWATQCKPILGNFLKALSKIAPVDTDSVPTIVPRDGGSPEIPIALGLQLSVLTDTLRQRYKINDQVKGVVVTANNFDTSFGFLSPGDVIFEFAGQQVTSPSDLQSKVEQLKRQGISSGLIWARTPDGHVRTISIRLNAVPN
jgi:S1-C subfamily serine protease